MLSDGQINKITVVDLDEIPTPKRHVLNSNQQPDHRITPLRPSKIDDDKIQKSQNMLALPEFDSTCGNAKRLTQFDHKMVDANAEMANQ